MLLVFAASYRAVERERRGGWVILAAAAGVQFGLNSVFHLAAAAYFGEYSPAMLTAACLGLPGSVVFLRWVHQQRRLTGRELAAASALGVAIVAAAIGGAVLALSARRAALRCRIVERAGAAGGHRPGQGRWLAWVHAADRIRWRRGGSLGSREH